MQNPNDLIVDDTDAPAIEAGSLPPVDGAVIVSAADETVQPVIPTADQLDPTKPVGFNDPANAGVDSEAPYGRKADGTPAKKRGRKGSDAQFDRLDSVTATTQVRQQLPTNGKAPVIVADYGVLGQTAATLWFGVGTLAFGEDWEPDVKTNEPNLVANAFRDYFKSKDIRTIDPTVSLCLVLGSYTLARLNKPTVKSRLNIAVLWVKSKMPKFGRRQLVSG